MSLIIPRDDLVPLGDLELLDNERKLRRDELSGDDLSGDDLLSMLKLSVVPNIDCTLKLSLPVSCVGSGLHLSNLFGVVGGDCCELLRVDLSTATAPISILLFDNAA